MVIKKLEELETIRSDLQGNMELIIRTDDGEFNWDYGRELLEELLDDEIVRQSVTDEDIREAIVHLMIQATDEEIKISDEFTTDREKEIAESSIKKYDLAIEALKAYRPRPKKAVYKGETQHLDRVWACPSCGGAVGLFFHDTWLDKCCAHCGQALTFHEEEDWEEEDE